MRNLTFLPLFTAFLFLNAVSAFMPWDWRENLVGKGGTSHQKMTRDAFLLLSQKYWPSIPDLTASMIKARDTIVNANGEVDKDQKHSSKHFDAENFDGGQYVLTGQPVVPQPIPLDPTDINLLQQIQDFLGQGKGEEAREALGKALHTIQDFYSHSNWVELGNSGPHPGIGRPPPEGSDAKMVTGVGHLENTCTTCAGALLSPGDENVCVANCVLPVVTDGVTAILEESILLGIKTGAEALFAKLCVDDCHCNDCSHNIITPGLTSGYYHGEDISPPAGVTKCRHGGDLDNLGAEFSSIDLINQIAEYVTGVATSPTEGINKDSLDCGWSSHFGFHNAAVSLAVQATEQFVDDIKAAITTAHDADTAEQQMKLLFGVGPIMAFVVDTTGSMGDIIDAVSAQLISIVDERVGTLSEPSKYILTPFNDPADAVPFSTVDATLFKTALGELFASGGGDCPEPSMEGLLSALAAIDPGADVFLITDATSKDPDLLSQVVLLANSKQIHVYTFLFDSFCSDVGVYFDLAVATNGGFFPLGRSEAGLITQQVDFWLQPDLTPVASFSSMDFTYGIGAKKFRRGTTTFDIPVDGFTSVIQFTIKGQIANVVVTRPDGSTVSPTDSGVTFTVLSTATFIAINSPATGVFTVTITGDTEYTLDVFARSPINFSFDFASYVGRPDHSGWGPDPTIVPTPGTDIPALAKLDGGSFTDVKFQIRSATGTVLRDNLPFAQGGGDPGQPGKDTFFGFVNLPPVSCLIYVTGTDSSGKQFVRVHPIVFIPSLSAGAVPSGLPSSIASGLPLSSGTPLSSAAVLASGFPVSESPRIVSSRFDLFPSGGVVSLPASSFIPSSAIAISGPHPNPSAPLESHGPSAPHISAQPSKSTSTAGSSSGGRTTDVTTIITKTIIKPCPHKTTTVKGTVTTITESTICLTIQSVLPCECCEGPNYGGPNIQATGTGSPFNQGGKPGQGGGNCPTCKGSPNVVVSPTGAETVTLGGNGSGGSAGGNVGGNGGRNGNDAGSGKGVPKATGAVVFTGNASTLQLPISVRGLLFVVAALFVAFF